MFHRLFAILTALMLVAVGGLSLAPQAQAAPQYEAMATMSQIETDDAGVTLKGTITSTGTDPLFQVEVVLWGETTPITDPTQLAAVLAEDPEADIGDRVRGDEARTVVAKGRQTFEPGQTAEFSVTATWEELGLSDRGAYLVGVHVRACSTAWGPQVTIGRGRTLVTVPGSDTVTTATVAMLTSQPSLIHDNVFTDDHLAGELAGRLDDLMTLAHQAGVTWVVDPALYYEISVMAKGYEVMAGDSTTPGTGTAAAAQWLTSFEGLNAAYGYRLPWGNPDVALGAATGSVQMIASAQSGEQAHPELSKLPVLLWAAGGTVDDAWLTYAEPFQAEVVLADVASDATLPGGVALDTATQAYPDGPGPTDGDTPQQRIQRALVDDLIAPTPVIRVVSTQAEAALVAQTARNWIRTVSLKSITPATQWSSALSLGDPTSVLTSATVDQIARLGATADAYSSLTGDDTAGEALVGVPLAAGLSQSWPDDASAEGYVLAADHWLRRLFDQVTMTATPEVSLTSRTSTFPVTVTNTMSVAVHVRLLARTAPDSGSSGNVSIPPTDVMTIEPGDKMPLVLSPTILREGDASLVLQLTTSDGTPIATPVTVAVHAQESAWMGWLVVGSAFILFIVGTFVRVRSKSSKRAGSGAAASPPSTATSPPSPVSPE